MTDWKEQLLHKVKATHKRHLLLCDEDFLLEYPSVNRMVQEVFTIVRCETPIQVRIEFELRFDDPAHRYIFLVPPEYRPLPDMEQRSYFLKITLNDLFPLFDRASLIGRDEELLDFISAQKVYDKQNKVRTIDWIEKFTPAKDAKKERQSAARATTALEALLSRMEEAKTEDSLPEFWFDTVQSLAEIRHNLFAHSFPQLEERFGKAVLRLNRIFQQFLVEKYGTLHTRSGVQKPYTVGRILDHLEAQSAGKTALIVLDGMSFWQWEIIEGMLSSQKTQLETGATFAFIPSITAFSRQSLLRGAYPDLTQDNSKESQLFKEYWLGKGKQAHQIQYVKFGVSAPFQVENLSNSVDMLALVCNDLDDIMHGSTLGDRQLFHSTWQWVQKSHFPDLVDHLLAKGFTCYITTDHGNVEAQGNGLLQQKDKVGVYSRSKRHLNFANKILLDRFKSQQEMSRFGENELSIYIKDLTAFGSVNATLVTHGGSHIWEVLIPFIKISHEQA